MKTLRGFLRGRKYEGPPPQIVIGHTTDRSVKVWVRGDAAHRSVQVTVDENAASAQAGEREQKLELNKDDDFTGVVQFEDLVPQLGYSVKAHFSRSGAGSNGDVVVTVEGRFRTFPRKEAAFSFLHGSCNLSIVTVNNTLALAAGASGTKAIRASLERPPTPTGDWKRLKRFLFRWRGYAAVGHLIKILFDLSLCLTDWLKQPGEPKLRSPFLRLSGQIETWTLAFEAGEEEPTAGSAIVGARSRATGYVFHRPEASGSWTDKNAAGCLELSQVDGTFESSEALCIAPRTAAVAVSDAVVKNHACTIAFEAGEDEPSRNSLIYGASSRATGRLDGCPKVAGAWADGDAAGSFELSQVNGVFEPGEALCACRTMGRAAAKSVEIRGTWSIEFKAGRGDPRVGDTVTSETPWATGILAYPPTLTAGLWADGTAVGVLELVQVEGVFTSEAMISIGSSTNAKTGWVHGMWSIDFEDGGLKLDPGDEISGETSGATGTLAYRPEINGSWEGGDASGSFMLTGVSKEFEKGEFLLFGEQKAARSTSKARALEPVEDVPAFMIHAGDQIYFDFPFSDRRPSLDEYRMAYREAWSEDIALRAFLAQCPHYMTLDDHEIVDQFAVDNNSHKYPPDVYLRHARAAYREYVHKRHPGEKQNALYYEFQCGTARFFVMDTRTERCRQSGRMIGPQQLEDFKQWLQKYPHDLKFVVSGVPFVGELRDLPPTPPPADPGQRPLVPDTRDRDDKWCGEGYRRQREEIIDFIGESHKRAKANQDIRRLIFLVGDTHCCYHATMDIGYRPAAIHELGASPVYQLEFSRRDQFIRLYRGTIERKGNKKARTYRIELRQFDSSAAGIIKLRVRCLPGQFNGHATSTQEVAWQVIRTLGDAEAIGGRVRSNEHGSLRGRIHFWECHS